MPPKNKPIAIPDFTKIQSQKSGNFANKNINNFPDTNRRKIIKPVDYTFRTIVFGILAILLFVGVYFVYNYSLDFLDSKEKAQEQKFVFENALVRGDRSRVISLEAGANKETVRGVLVQALKNERMKMGEISIITPSYLRDTIIDNERKLVSEPQRGDDFFFTFAVRSPLNLRALSGDKYALGTVGVTDDKLNGSRNFFAFSVSSAPDAVREMLRYENQIYYDMKEVLKLKLQSDGNLKDLKGDFKFTDLSDNNLLLRIGTDDDGVVMVYGFPAPKTILITPDTETYKAVVARLK